MSVPVSVKPGDVIGDIYVIERLLGQGGMGAVFVAHEERLGRRVAIKVLLAEVANNPEAGGAPYIVMELLDGETSPHFSSPLARRLVTYFAPPMRRSRPDANSEAATSSSH